MRRAGQVCLIVFLVVLSTTAVFYARYDRLADDLESSGMSGDAANAVKHALAATEIYGVLSRIGMSGETAEEIIMRLGFVNEALERITKFNRPDSLAEMMKDTYNNAAGVRVGRFLAGCTGMKARPVVIRLARDGRIATTRNFPFLRQMASEHVDHSNPLISLGEWFAQVRVGMMRDIDAGLHLDGCRP